MTENRANQKIPQRPSLTQPNVKADSIPLRGSKIDTLDGNYLDESGNKK